MSNEDLFALRRLAAGLGRVAVDHRVPPVAPGDEDDFLIRADKNPNTKGAELIGLATDGAADGAGVLAAAAAGRLRMLWIFQHDLFDSAWPEAQVEAALRGGATVVFQGTNANRVSAAAQLVLPSAAYFERDGTFTNFQGRVQRFRAAAEPLGEVRPDWWIVGQVARALGLDDPLWRAERADQVFAALAAAVPAYATMSYRALGDRGMAVRS
jgi:NADH-quinone oxidoreductase subunit G